MDSERPLVVTLRDAGNHGEKVVGGKAARLAGLASAGFTVPRGFCITTWAYRAFVDSSQINATIRMELGRKPMDDMRWEEMWDVALRIRSLFLSHPCSEALQQDISSQLLRLDVSGPLAVRSSSPSEDAPGASFAGLHESFLGVKGSKLVQDAVRLVWASLWSDAALLYRRELGLDPAKSQMAVLVQEMVDSDRSGVAFGCDPRTGNKNLAIIESVPGPCSLLVDGTTDPDRWEMDRNSREIVGWSAGEREEDDGSGPLLTKPDLQAILDALLAIEGRFLWTPDMEWCGRSQALTVLQARPVTTGASDGNDKRNWYLTLRPGDGRLREIRRRVAGELIPELEAEGNFLAAEDLDNLDDLQLAGAIEQRHTSVAKWKKIYWDEFIPFAHGVRRLATYYNDAVQPEDPYEFVGLLKNQPLIAVQRNKAIEGLAKTVRLSPNLETVLDELVSVHTEPMDWHTARNALGFASDPSVAGFIIDFEELIGRYLDIAYDQERLFEDTGSLLRNILELARDGAEPPKFPAESDSPEALEQRLLTAVGAERSDEAREMIEIGRISWKLRDDDNLLVARLESQLLRALEIGARRLGARGLVKGEARPAATDAESIILRLRDPSATEIEFQTSPKESRAAASSPADNGSTPRQLIGQPASPGIASGAVRRIKSSNDLGRFRRGEVLVCDAIQPTMTHLVPLASAIVERRGGMLIHGAIISRELGIPCVNGIRSTVELIKNGDVVTVDGYLGIVTLGAPDFELELHPVSEIQEIPDARD